MRHGWKFLAFFICWLIIFSSCKPSTIYQKSIHLENEVWTYKDTLDYKFIIKDTFKYYDLFLKINHNPEFSNQNLYSRIYTSFPDGTEAVDTISLELTDKFGNWLGDCSKLSCELDLLLKGKTKFRHAGNYELRLEQYNRKDSIKGIQSIEIRIAEYQE